MVGRPKDVAIICRGTLFLAFYFSVRGTRTGLKAKAEPKTGRPDQYPLATLAPPWHTMWTSLVMLFPLTPKLFALIHKIVRHFFVILLPHFSAAPKFLNRTFTAPPISRHSAKFHGDRSRGFGDFALKPIAPKLFWGRPPILLPTLSKCHTSNHV